MEKVGKVNQLNIINRWRINDSTTSLRAEVGVGGDGDLMYLDLHEKFHGPHGLIAGMTGSGKSEFIITYILSMCINYSPDDVAFILIDYKGGVLAGAFENKANNIVLPHLAGTITNLDKAEMDRTLVSIDSELKRRQSVFNEARDKLGESTIDIYKYQRFYKDGRLEEAIPHLFIICDEFAELKSQQPDFMESLISTARIGRSLGVHLILATQKPSGVVNEQIWSNTKFRVCLKVQDASDSNEMLKRPDAASLKQTGRFYLQVGYDEYFALGQSAWCGAKYYPS
jgi:S-DNA-T family DNA segregation ATPase FtsK/SpoIIIE